MKLDFNLNLSQEQKLVMTLQMQLSIKLLQMSSCELREYIDKEFTENPMLEGDFDIVQEEKNYQDKIDYKEMIKNLEFDNYGSPNYNNYDSDNDVSPFNFISQKKSLNEYLHEQVLECNEEEFIKTVVGYMIENLDNRGYLEISLSNICKEINISKEIGNEALEVLQDLEPDGIGARSLKECLKIQLIKRGILEEKLENIIENHLDLIADNKYQVIAKELKISQKEAQDYGDLIKQLEPKPSRGFYTGEEVKFIIPDAFIRKINGEYFAIINEGAIPKLSINNIYKQILNNKEDKKAEEYVKNKFNSAIFLIKSIEMRKSTLLRILEKIVIKQKDYLDKGQKYLKPMSLKEIAEELEIHESTVSRAVRDKYVLTSMGTIKIKDMFTKGMSSTSESEENVAIINVKKRIKAIIDEEDKKKPLSDQIICNELNKDGLNISRRTIAKYREELDIKSSTKRKRI